MARPARHLDRERPADHAGTGATGRSRSPARRSMTRRARAALAGSTSTRSTWQPVVGMVVLGLGLGMVMQVLVLAVQNAVDYRLLGVATSGSTLFRQVGGSIGVAMFGAIFANRLRHGARPQPAGRRSRAGRRQPGRDRAPAAARSTSPTCRRSSRPLQPIFLAAAAISRRRLRAHLAAPRGAAADAERPRDRGAGRGRRPGTAELSSRNGGRRGARGAGRRRHSR